MAVPVKTSETDDGWSMSGRRERAVMQSDELASDGSGEDHMFPTARGRLSAGEIEALLRPDLSDLEPEISSTEPVAVQDVSPPDFSHPAETNEDRQICAATASRLSLALRRDCAFDAAIALEMTETCSFRDAMALAEPGWATAFLGDDSGQIMGALLLSPNLVSAFIEAACGGMASMPGTTRTLTPVDAALLGNLIAPLAKAAREDLSIVQIETDARYAVPLAPPRAVTVMKLSVLSGDQTTAAVLVLSNAPDVMETDVPVPVSFGQTAPSGVTAALTARIASLSVPVSRLSDLKPGSTLLLGLRQDEPVELLSGGRSGELVAEGEIGRKGDKMAIRIVRRGPMLRRGV